MSDLLFAYGSLVSALAHPQGERLRREAALLGSATLQGRLYRVSWYPGVVASDQPGERVHGEVYRLTTPEQTMPWLDEYEGIVPGATSAAPSDDYARRLCDVVLASGDTVRAWVYLYRRSTADLERVADGRWRG